MGSQPNILSFLWALSPTSCLFSGLSAQHPVFSLGSQPYILSSVGSQPNILSFLWALSPISCLLWALSPTSCLFSGLSALYPVFCGLSAQHPVFSLGSQPYILSSVGSQPNILSFLWALSPTSCLFSGLSALYPVFFGHSGTAGVQAELAVQGADQGQRAPHQQSKSWSRGRTQPHEQCCA